MTGGLVDKHMFVSLTTYSHIQIQPFDYALEYNEDRMLKQWVELKGQGKKHRQEVANEHDSFSDELHFSVNEKLVKSHETDDYDEAYTKSEEEYVQYDYTEEEEEEEEGDDKKKKKQKKDEDPGRAKLIEDLNKILSVSPIGKRLGEAHAENAKMVQKIHKQMTSEMQKATDRLHNSIRLVRDGEKRINERILEMGKRLDMELVDVFAETKQRQASGWRYAFLFVGLLLVGMSVYGYLKYRKFMKSHVL